MRNANRVPEKDFTTDFETSFAIPLCSQIQIQESFPISKTVTRIGLQLSSPLKFPQNIYHFHIRYLPPLPPPSPSKLNYVTKHSFFYSRRRLGMEPEQQQNFWRNVQCIVEKDVVRTDRSNPYFAGENNPNIDVMK